MAITQVRVQINGQWTILSKNAAGKYTGTITAPATTSYNLSGGYYPVTVEARNDAGTVKTETVSSVTLGASLRLYVKEQIRPVITLLSPSNGALTINNQQPVRFQVVDETGGSGVKLSSVSLKIDGNTYNQSSAGMTKTAVTGGYQFTYAPTAVLADGVHNVTINAQDNDGNAAAAVTSRFTIDTTPPQLNITSPVSGLITNNASIVLSGTTNDLISSPVTVKGTLNGTDIGLISINTDGAFEKALTLAEGVNTIVITATDAAGKQTKITLSPKLDTSVPQVNSVSIGPNPANASESIQITIEVV